MTRSLETPLGTYFINSPKVDNIEHMGWEQADRYILQTLYELNIDLTHAKLALVNDEYGALSKSLEKFNITLFSDSAVSCFWIHQNLDEHMKIYPIEALMALETDLVLIKLPKNLVFFRYILYLICFSRTKHVLISGMQKYWSQGFYSACHEFFQHVNILPGKKKAKVVELSQPRSSKTIDWTSTQIFNDMTLINYPNVFAKDKVDIGSRFFIENFPALSPSDHIIDLGCGNGILGINALKLDNSVTVTFIDESRQAILSCEASLKENQIDKHRYRLSCIDVLDDKNIDKADVILCNPPFHDKHRITDHIAIQMIKQSRLQLRNTGKIFLIGNRHLNYHKLLRQLFNDVGVIASNKKFVLYQASCR